jgi:hypothetical protein
MATRLTSQTVAQDAQYSAMALGMGALAQQICVIVSAAEREQLAGIAADRNRPRKHVERVRIVLASADRHAAQRVRKARRRPADGVAPATTLCRERG